MKRISTACAALVALGACGSAAAQPASTNPNDFAIGAGAGAIGVPSLSTVMPPPVPGIGAGVPSFGGPSSGDCPFGIAILCIPLPGAGIDSGLAAIGGSSPAPNGLVPGVINVPPLPDPLSFGTSSSGLNTSTIGGSAIGVTPIGGLSPGLINSLVPSPFDPFGATPGLSTIGGAPPMGGSAAGPAAPLPAPGAGGGSGAGSSLSGPSSPVDPVFCTPDQLGCL